MKYWMRFVGVWQILGCLIFMPFSWNVSDFVGWSAPSGSIEEKLAYFSSTHLAISFLVMGIFLLLASKDPVKNSVLIILAIVTHSYVYCLNLYSVYIEINQTPVTFITQVDLLIVLLGIFAYRKLLKADKTRNST